MYTIDAVPPPNSKEVQEFQFKLLARLRLFKENPNLPLKQSLSLVAVAAKYGLIFAGTLNGFDVIETAKIVEQCAGVKKPAAEVTDFPRRSVVLGAQGQPTHLDVSCDGQHLAVAFTLGGVSVIRIYDVTSLASQNERVVNEVRVSAPLRALSWNPGTANLLAVCMQDGSAAVYEFKNNSFEISSIPAEAYATCLCWSPKGKQIVIGSRNGTLNQFRPDLKIVKSIPPPQDDLSLVSVQWLSSPQYACVYCHQSTGTGPNLLIVNTPKNQPHLYVNYEDITYSNGDNRLTQFYFIHQQTWNVLLVASANSMEVGVLGFHGEWEQWQLEDAARAELPLSPSRQETHPVGMAFDTSVQYNIPWGENQHLPPMPLLLLLSHEGLLTFYWTVNLLGGATSVCVPPEPLPDTSGLRLYTPQQPQAAPPTQVVTMPTPAPVAQPAPVIQPAPVPVSFLTPTPVAAVTSIPQWQQPPPTSQPAWTQSSPLSIPKPENKQATSAAPGSWMSAPTTFMSSLSSQSAFNPAHPAFNVSLAPAAAPPPATAAPATTVAPFSINPAAPSAFSVSSPNTQTPFSFASLQGSDALNKSGDSLSKPGAFVSPSVPVSSPITPVPSAAQVAPATPPTPKTDLPSVPSQPVTRPSTPEQENTEESQRLKDMNNALIQEAIREEVAQFDQELADLGQRVRGIDMSVLNDDELASVTEELNSMSSFMRELKDTTSTQESEIDSLRSFLLESFAYIESMRARMKLQSNPDYMSIQSPQGLDPLQARKMADIKRNLQLIESQLVMINSELSTNWTMFQEANKENREVMQIPSLETIYQAMMVHNNVMMGQKKRLDSLEKKMRSLNRKRLIKAMNISQCLDDTLSPDEQQDTEFSKVAQDFMSLNLSKLKSDTFVDDLKKSIASLGVSEGSLHTSKWKSGITSGDAELLKATLEGIKVKSYTYKRPTNSPHKFWQGAVAGTSTPVTGSISSGEPVTQSKSPQTSVKEGSVIRVSNKRACPIAQETTTAPEESPISAFIAPISTVSNTNFSVPSTKTSTAQNTLANPSSTTNNMFLSQGIKSSGITFPKQEIEFKNIPKSSPTVSSFGGYDTVSSPQVTIEQTKIPTYTSKPIEGLTFTSFVVPQPSTFKLGTSVSFPALSSSGPNTANTQSLVSVTPQPKLSDSAFGKKEILNIPSPSSTASFPFAISSPESTFTAGASSTTSPISSPLSSLSSLVSGIQPLKSDLGLTNAQNKAQLSNETNTPKSVQVQPFVFKVQSTMENKSSEKEPLQKTNLFGFSVENNSGLKDTVEDHKGKTDESKSQSSETSTKLSTDMSVKSIFGKSTQGTGLETPKSESTPKNIFGGSVSTSTPPKDQTNVFGGYVTTSTPQKDQANIFGGSATIITPQKDQTNIFGGGVTLSTPQKGQTNIFGGGVTLSTPQKGQTNIFGGGATTITPQKDQTNIFGGSATTIIPQKDQTNIFGGGVALSTPQKGQTNIFGGSVTTSTPQKDQKTVFGGQILSNEVSSKAEGQLQEITKSAVSQSDNGSPVIEVSLNPSTSMSETKLLLEKLSGTKGLSITKVDAPERKSPLADSPKTDNANTGSTVFGSLNFSSFTTPTKPVQSVFGGSTTPVKPSVMYEVEGSTSSAQVVSTSEEPGDESKSVEPEKQPEATKPQNLFYSIPKTTPATSFSFSSSTLQSTSSAAASVQTPPQSTGFSFQIEPTTETTSVSSTSSVLPAASQASSPGFTFTVPSPNTSSSASNTLGFGSLSTGFSKEKTETVFGEQVKNLASTTASVFGGFSSKPTEVSSIFGQSTTATGSVFGQTPSSTAGTTNVFGQISSTTVETKSVFDQTPTTTAGTQPEFSFALPTSTTSAQPSIFGSQATTTASFFGQSICSPASTVSSPFGQPNTTPAFGSTMTSPFGSNTSGFGSKPTFGQSGGSFFGQSSGGFGTSGTSLFGGNTPSSGTSLFGSSTSQPASPFASSTGGGAFGGGSFSAGGQTVGQTGFGSPAFQNKPVFGATSPSFGSPPSFGGAPTFGSASAFGSPPKPFGNTSASPTSAFGGAAQQQSATFENLATQDTMTFGNLAHNQQQGFGSVFPPAQNNPPAAAFPTTTTGSMFGGSSFSSWR